MLRAHYANALAAALCFMTSASRSTPSGLPLAAKPTVAGGYLVVNDDFSAVNNGVTKGNTLSTLTPYFSGNVHGIYQVLPIGDLVGEFAYGDWKRHDRSFGRRRQCFCGRRRDHLPAGGFVPRISSKAGSDLTGTVPHSSVRRRRSPRRRRALETRRAITGQPSFMYQGADCDRTEPGSGLGGPHDRREAQPHAVHRSSARHLGT